MHQTFSLHVRTPMYPKSMITCWNICIRNRRYISNRLIYDADLYGIHKNKKERKKHNMLFIAFRYNAHAQFIHVNKD